MSPWLPLIWLALGTPASPVDASDRWHPDETVPEAERLELLRAYQQAERRQAERKRELLRQQERLEALRDQVEGRFRTLRLLQEELKAALPSPDGSKADGSKADGSKADGSKADDSKAAEQERARHRKNAQRLAKVFGKMKPDEAARVIQVMDEDLSVEVLCRIRDRQGARILGGVPPALAARISAKMAAGCVR